MSPIEELDTALIQVCGLEVIADACDNQPLVDACHTVLDGLLDARIHLPLQRVNPHDTPSDAPAC